MRRYGIAGIAMIGLSACGDPLDKVEKLPAAEAADGTAVVSALADPAVEENARQGLFGLLLPAAQDKATPEGKADDSLQAGPASEGAASESKPGPFSGLFRKSSAPQQAAQPTGIPLGSKIPFGEVALICGQKPSALGQKVASHPARNPVYKLYDSAPGAQHPHAFYITGFDDGCARQVTASVALFGSVEMHEQLRYGLPADVQPYSDTDKAYEKVKRRVCGAPRKKPCGQKIDRLKRDTVFLSLYDRYGGASDWGNVLLHKGAMVAHDIKSN